MNSKQKYLYLFFFSCCFFSARFALGQFYNMPNEYFSSLITEKNLSVKGTSLHAAAKPYIHFFSPDYVNQSDTHRIFKYIVDDPGIDLAFYKHLITIRPHGENYRFIIDPVLHVDMGRDHFNGREKRTSTNTRGIIAAGYVGSKVYFESMFAENQAILPRYIDTVARASGIVPGQGRWKDFKKAGFDYAFTSGFVSLQPVKNFNVQFGHGKQKFGNGYRSLLLSDNAFNYPYARFTQQWFKGKLQYTNVYAVLMNLVPATKIPVPNAERLFQKKAAAFHYLSINPFRFLNLGFFQGQIWQAGDAKNRQRISGEFFNPLIYSNLIGYKLNNKNNILIGADAKVKLTNKINVYGQFMADDLSAGDGTGWQAGICFYDLFAIRNLFFQAEYNDVSEGSYRSPVSSTDQSWTHYGQPLAFTQGYGKELVFIGDYKFQRLSLTAKYHYQVLPKDGDYFFDTEMVNGRISYLVNSAYNVNAFFGFTYRNQNFPNFKNLINQTNYIYLGLRTSLYNFYYDF